MKKYDGVFKDWIFSSYTILSPDSKCVLWTANGKFGWGDYNVQANQQFLTNLSWWDKHLLWREYKRELKRRSLNMRYE